jgi:ABC-type transport system involved in cytochrome c biogenesis permease subunit
LGQAWPVHWPHRADLHVFLRQATQLALVALGSGFTVGAWWAWRTWGTQASGDPKEVWLAIAGLFAAMSWLARCMGRRWGRWTAGLALAAAAITIAGLLLVSNLQGLPGL